MAKLLGQTIKKIRTAKQTLRGVVLYEGPSELDGKPIVVVATFISSNDKTGNMVQTWIIRSDMKPLEVIATKQDGSICGNCPHKQSIGGACYVNVGQAPAAVYRSFIKGIYPQFNLADHGHLFAGRKVRLGAYGDPAAAPFNVMEQVTKLCVSHTGYTHQVAHKGFDTRFASLCMVSADSPKQAIKYQNLGYKTFRVAMAGDSLADDELECLADSEGLQCIDCGLCDGSKRNIAITVHGSKASKFKSSLIPTMQVA